MSRRWDFTFFSRITEHNIRNHVENLGEPLRHAEKNLLFLYFINELHNYKIISSITIQVGEAVALLNLSSTSKTKSTNPHPPNPAVI